MYVYLLFIALVLREQLGDYGHFTNSRIFHRKGNIFTDIKSLSPEVVITPRQHGVSMFSYPTQSAVTPHNPGLSLPTNCVLNSWLVSFSPRLSDTYLVTRVVKCTPECESTYIYLVFLVPDGRISTQFACHPLRTHDVFVRHRKAICLVYCGANRFQISWLVI